MDTWSWLLPALAGLIVAGTLYWVKSFRYWESKGVTSVQPWPIIGSLKDIVFYRHSLGTLLQEIYRKADGLPFIGLYTFGKPVLVIRDVEILRCVLVKDFHVFADRMFQPNPLLDPLLARSIFSAKGKWWRDVRAHLSPTFTSSRLRAMLPLMVECAQQLVDHLDSLARQEMVVDAKEVCMSFTTDLIASCAFGLKVNSLKNPDNAFRTNLRQLFQFSHFKNIRFGMTFFAPDLASLLRLRLFEKQSVDFIRKTLFEAISHREKTKVKRQDFLDLLMELLPRLETSNRVGQGQTEFALESEDAAAQAFVFLLGGFETTSSSLAFLLHCLAAHPPQQLRARANARRPGALCYDALALMTYLQAAIAESLRMYPVFPFLERKALTDYKLPGTNVILDKGTGILVPIMGLHYDPNIYPNPQEFRPERFLETNGKAANTLTFLAFGQGPRICIGKRLSELTLKVAAAAVLSRFEVLLPPGAPGRPPLDPASHLLAPSHGLPLLFRRLPED